MSKQLIAEGTKVEVRGEKGIFTVLRQIGEHENPLKCVFELVNEHGDGYWREVAELMPTIGTHFEIDWQEWYDINCPSCGHHLHCQPNELQKRGYLAYGSGECAECGAVFSIYFNPFANRMIPHLAV